MTLVEGNRKGDEDDVNGRNDTRRLKGRMGNKRVGGIKSEREGGDCLRVKGR